MRQHLKQVKKIIILVFLLFVTGVLLIPNNPFDSCIYERFNSYFDVSYRCSNWPWFIYGIVYVGLCFLLGQRKLWFWFVMCISFFIIDSWSVITEFHVPNPLSFIFYSPFFHGALLAIVFVFMYSLINLRESVA